MNFCSSIKEWSLHSKNLDRMAPKFHAKLAKPTRERKKSESRNEACAAY